MYWTKALLSALAAILIYCMLRPTLRAIPMLIREVNESTHRVRCKMRVDLLREPLR